MAVPTALPEPETTCLKITARTRAVLHAVVTGTNTFCHHCDKVISWHPNKKQMQVICNVYKNNVWQGVEQYHSECYEEAGAPHGVATS